MKLDSRFFNMFTSKQGVSVMGKGIERFLQIETTFYDADVFFDWKEENDLLEIRFESESDISFSDISFLFSMIQGYFEKKKQQVLLLFFDFEGDQFYITSSLHDKRENILKKLPLYCDGGKLCVETPSSFSQSFFFHFIQREIFISYGNSSHSLFFEEMKSWMFLIQDAADFDTLLFWIQDWEDFVTDVNTNFFKEMKNRFPLFILNGSLHLDFRLDFKCNNSSVLPNENIIFLNIFNNDEKLVQFQSGHLPTNIKDLSKTISYLKSNCESHFSDYYVSMELFHHFFIEIKNFDTKACLVNTTSHSLSFLKRNYYGVFHVWKEHDMFQVHVRFHEHGNEETKYEFSGKTVEELYEHTKEYAQKIYKSERLSQLFS